MQCKTAPKTNAFTNSFESGTIMTLTLRRKNKELKDLTLPSHKRKIEKFCRTAFVQICD